MTCALSIVKCTCDRNVEYILKLVTVDLSIAAVSNAWFLITFLLILVVSLLIAAFLLSSLLTYLFGAPWVPTPKKIVRKMLTMAEVKPGEVVYDLGSGDGRIVMIAANEFGANAVGLEINPLWVLWNKLISLRSRNVKIIWANFFNVDLGKADVVTLYLWQDTNDRLKSKLEKELKRGSRVVSHAFIFNGWAPDKIDNKLKIYSYRVGTRNSFNDQTPILTKKTRINFLRRGIISILIGLFILVVGAALYLELNTGTRFLIIILGFSIPFLFIGSLLLRGHYGNRKRNGQKHSQKIKD